MSITSREIAYHDYYPIVDYFYHDDLCSENYELLKVDRVLDEMKFHDEIMWGGETMELLGLAEVSELLGWGKRKTTTYLKRGVLPEPIHIVKATPLWTREQIKTYKE